VPGNLLVLPSCWRDETRLDDWDRYSKGMIELPSRIFGYGATEYQFRPLMGRNA